MDANILCTLLAERIPPEQFRINDGAVEFVDPEKNNKPVGSTNESPFDTSENRAIVADVIANYEKLAAAYEAEQAAKAAEAKVKAALVEIDLQSIRPMREWIAKQPDAPQFILDYEAQAKNERNKLV